MALDLNLIITADASQAKRALADVESGIKKVEGAAKSTTDPISKVTSNIKDLSTATNSSADASQKSHDAFIAEMDAVLKAGEAKHRLTAETRTLTATEQALTYVFGAQATNIGLVTGVLTGLVGSYGAMALLVKNSIQEYDKQTGALNGVRSAVGHLGEAWDRFEFEVGKRLIGDTGTLSMIEDALDNIAETAKEIAPGMAAVFTNITGLDRFVQKSKETAEWWQMLSVYVKSVRGDLDGDPTPFYPGIPRGYGRNTPLPVPNPTLGERNDSWRYPRNATEPGAPRRVGPLADGPGWMYTPGTLPGSLVGVPNAPFWPGSVGAPRWLPGDPVLAGGPGAITGIGDGGWLGGFNGVLPGATGVWPGGGRGPGFMSGAFGGAAGFGGGLANTILEAITGGGSLVGGIGSYVGGGLGSQLGKSLGGMVGGIGGGALNAILPGIGSLLGPALGWLGDKLFGPTDYELRKRQEGEDRRTATELVNTPGLANQWNMLGGAMPFGFDFLKTQVIHDPTAVKGYLDEMVTKTERLTAAMQKYGITWEELGDQAQQSQIDTMAKTLIEDFEILTLAGADVTFVIEKMSGSVQDFVDSALRTGSEVPAGMQPMIEKMVEMGLLTDENGNAFKSLEDTGLTFAKTMTEGFDSIVTAIGHLAKALGYDIPEAIDKIPKEVEIDVNYRESNRPESFQESQDGASYEDGNSYHNGGYVWPRFHRGGEVPAILQSGEFVMSRAAVGRLGRQTLSALNSGGGTGGLTVNVTYAQPVMASDHSSMARFASFMADATTQELRRRGVRMP
jgi:hypothetical protein